MNRPVVVIGNKVDLLPQDGPKFLERITSCLREEVTKVSGIRDKNIKHVSVVSAKTGYGIEKLINKLHSNWSVQGTQSSKFFSQMIHFSCLQAMFI
jgi:nitric oxide-associated protein 1